MIIYTLGTSNRTPDEFKKILEKYRIDVVVDVRRFPTSRLPHFKRENLKKLCEEKKVEYLYMGNELGGYRKEGYEKFKKTDTFQRGVEILYSIAKKRAVCILCAERWPGKCHRRYITDALKTKGAKIVHIIDVEKTWEPE